MKNIFLIFIVFIIVACVPPVKSDRITTASGKLGHTIDCKNAFDMGQCYKRAGEVCIKGYTILQSTNKSGGLFYIPEHNLVIECKE